MKIGFVAAIAILVVGASVASAQERADPIAVATASGVCGESPVLTAVYTDDGTISATCESDPTAFVPIAGPLAALLGVGLLAATGDADGTTSTGSTSGTN